MSIFISGMEMPKKDDKRAITIYNGKAYSTFGGVVGDVIEVPVTDRNLHGETYSAEEYRDTLKAVYAMDVKERRKAFGVVYDFFSNFVNELSASELIEKYHAYKDAPKAGEYWKDIVSGGLVVIKEIRKDEHNSTISFYNSSGISDIRSYDEFIKYFTKTHNKSKYMELFLAEMKKAEYEDTSEKESSVPSYDEA